MILVIGGQASGKRAWVEEHLGYHPDQMGNDPGSDLPVLYDLQDASPGVSVQGLVDFEVIVCNEIGCGLVPVDPDERERRERVGRLLCELAKKADAVVRVDFGCGSVIKCAPGFPLPGNARQTAGTRYWVGVDDMKCRRAE
jgi:hypothetical protein